MVYLSPPVVGNSTLHDLFHINAFGSKLDFVVKILRLPNNNYLNLVVSSSSMVQ